MSGRTKELLTNHVQPMCKVVLEIGGKRRKLLFVPAKYIGKLEAFLEKYGEAESVLWEEIAAERIAKYTKVGLVLRGARYREGLSQKELSKRSGVSQENISKMENGTRPIGAKVAEKLAKALRIKASLLKNPE